MLGDMWQRVRGLFSPQVSEEEVHARLDKLREQTPVPVFWLLGKTQSGKTSVVRYLTGAERAEIGKGYQPCTRFTSKYVFPNEQTPLLTFFDTRGLDEPGYDPKEDIAQLNDQAHVILVVVKLLDHAQQTLMEQLPRIRAAKPSRPIVLVLTCLHEAYPQQQHPEPYPFTDEAEPTPAVSPELQQSLAAQRARFARLVDRVVLIDLTQPEEGYTRPDYGGEQLRHTLLDVLPSGLAQTLRTLAIAQHDLQNLFSGKAAPTIAAYSTLAATAGAVPLPFVDLILISGVQTRMLYDLAHLYGQPLTKQRLAEVAGALGLGLLGRQAGRTLIKVIPGLGTIIGSVAGGALAAASTYALGKAFCYYYQAVLEGHVPNAKDLKKYYNAQLEQAEDAWKRLHPPEKKS